MILQVENATGWWFQTFFSIIYGIILPIDQYFSRWLKPPTSAKFEVNFLGL